MKTLTAFLNDLAAKAKIAPDDQQLKDILASGELQKINVPDELVNSIEGSLVSLEEAKNNHPVIKSHYTAQAYDGIDAELDRIMNDLQIPDSVKLVIKNEKLTGKKVQLLTAKIKELESAKRSTDDKGEKQSLQKTIDDLNAELRSEKESKTQLQKDYETKENNLYKQNEINDMLGEYKTIFDELPKSARYAALNALINQTLQDKNAELVLDGDKKLKLVRKDGSNVFGDDNRPWTVKTLFEKSLSDNKALKVSGKSSNSDGKDDKNSNDNNTNPRKNMVIDGDNNDSKTKNGTSNVLSNLLDQSIKDLEAADKVNA